MSGRRRNGGNGSIGSSMRAAQATPTFAALSEAEIDVEATCRPDLVRDALGFYPSYSHTPSAMRAQQDGLLEDLVQHGVQQLREGKSLPPLSHALRARRRPQTSPSPLPVERTPAALEATAANEMGFGTSDKAAAEVEAITAAASKAATRQLFAGAGMEVVTTKKGSGGRRAATVPAASFSLSQQVKAVRMSVEAEYR